MNKTDHWNKVYQTKDSKQVSWFQKYAETSLKLIKKYVKNNNAHIIDIGAGASTLVDGLIAENYTNIDLLDISAEALNITRNRINAHSHSSNLNWHYGDVLDYDLALQYFDVWHDRAVFHFLTDIADQQKYVQQVLHTLKPGGTVIISTFGPDGPLKCSGLPIVRYDHDTLQKTFGDSFELLEHGAVDHRTPKGSVQKFIYCCFKLQQH